MTRQNRSDPIVETTAETRSPADDVPGQIVALAFSYPSGTEVAWHRHRRSQLVFAIRGVVTVHTGTGTWVLPTARALWVPAGEEHRLRMTGDVELRTIYFASNVLSGTPPRCEVLAVPALLRELIVRAVAVGPVLQAHESDPRQALVCLLIEELREARRKPLEALHLPEGTDPRIRRVMEGLRGDLTDPATLREWGRRVGASERTLARRFVAETGLTFGRWRQQLRLQRAFELLAAGLPVSQVAGDVGYESLSAFITMFHRATGHTPSEHFS